MNIEDASDTGRNGEHTIHLNHNPDLKPNPKPYKRKSRR